MSPDHLPAQEATWLAGLRAGNTETYREIFEALTPGLWRFACVSVPPDIAEDIVQDVMFNLWERRTTLRVTDGLAQFLFGAVRNRVLQHLRHTRVTDRSMDAVQQQISMAPDDPARLAEFQDIQQALTRILQQLPEIQRAILVLRWTHEMSYDQIASILSISPEAAAQHVSRSRKFVLPLLEKFRAR